MALQYFVSEVLQHHFNRDNFLKRLKIIPHFIYVEIKSELEKLILPFCHFPSDGSLCTNVIIIFGSCLSKLPFEAILSIFLTADKIDWCSPLLIKSVIVEQFHRPTSSSTKDCLTENVGLSSRCFIGRWFVVESWRKTPISHKTSIAASNKVSRTKKKNNCRTKSKL